MLGTIKYIVALNFDIFMAPHHCSWTYFNNVPYMNGETDKPVESSKTMIKDHKTNGAVIIASSKQIKKDKDNPPHHQSKEEYVKLIGADKFISLAEEPDSKKPKPVVYEVTSSFRERTSP